MPRRNRLVGHAADLAGRVHGELGAPTSTVGTPIAAAVIGPIVEPQGMSCG